MSKYTGGTLAAGGRALALGAALALAACTSGTKQDALARDSTLALATAADSTQPQLRDVPATAPAPAPAPAATAPAAPARASTPRTPAPHPAPRPRATPAAPAPAPARTVTSSGNTVTRGTSGGGGRVGTVPSGTTLSLASDSRVCTNTNRVGDVITATLANAVTGSNGAVIPAGARVTLAVTELKRSENATDKIRMGFAVRSITFAGRTYPVSASVASAQVDRVKNQPSAKDAQKVATGAAVGAVVGQILGHSTKSTVIGGAIGAAAGAGTAAATANYEGCVPTGGRIVVSLNAPLQVTT